MPQHHFIKTFSIIYIYYIALSKSKKKKKGSHIKIPYVSMNPKQQQLYLLISSYWEQEQSQIRILSTIVYDVTPTIFIFILVYKIYALKLLVTLTFSFIPVYACPTTAFY